MAEMLWGHVARLSVRDVILDCCGSFLKNGIAVIRSLDSSRGEKEVCAVLAFHGTNYRVENGNVRVDMNDLLQAAENGVLTGFDEVWLFDGSGTVESLDEAGSATGDAGSFQNGVPGNLEAAFIRTHCLLLLGDGIGLNYATRDSALDGCIRSILDG